jgi:ParB-like nuclease domain
MSLPFHHLADIFPLLEGDQFKELADDIRANGLHEPIMLYEGAILDGRNRYRACLKAGVPLMKFNFDEYKGSDPVAFVVSKNLKRRHLDESQRAMVAAEIAKLPMGTSKNRRFPPPCKSDSRLSCSERGRLAWGSLASSI